MTPWITEELATVDLQDKRLNQRYARILERCFEAPKSSLTGAMKGNAEVVAAMERYPDAPRMPAPGRGASASAGPEAGVGDSRHHGAGLHDQNQTARPRPAQFGNPPGFPGAHPIFGRRSPGAAGNLEHGDFRAGTPPGDHLQP